MLDNLLFLFTDTVLPWYLIILFAQILFLWFAKRKKNRVLWIVLYTIMIGSTVLSCAAVFKFAYGISDLANEFISIGALLGYALLLSYTLILKMR